MAINNTLPVSNASNQTAGVRTAALTLKNDSLGRPLNAPNFGTVFQEQSGRAPTQAEVNEFIDFRDTFDSQTSNLFNTTSATKVVSGSDTARNDANLVKKDATSLSADISDLDTTTTVADIKTQIGYQDPNAPLTAAEQAQIEAEGVTAGAQYDDLIRTAEDAKKSGLPKALIAAGERGGFMSTQFSGVGALTQTEGGTFIGAGGELENIKSAYDKNIQSMKAAKVQAIRLAKEAAEKAIRTGKREDNEMAMDLFKMAQDANTKAVALAQAKVDLVNSVDTAKQAKIKFNVDTVSDLASTGQPLTDQFKQQIDAVYGEGYADKLYETSRSLKAAKSVEDEIGLLKDVYDLLDKVPAGESVKIGDNEYEGLKKDSDSHVYKETSPTGEVMIIEFDAITKAIKSYATGVKVKVNEPKVGKAELNFAEARQELEDSRGDDNYVNTAEYTKWLNKFKDDGKTSTFISNFPPEEYLNPKDKTAQKYFKTPSQTLKGNNDSDINSKLDALFKDKMI